MADFLFTWKEGKRLSYEKIKEIVDKFDAGQPVVEGWQCAAHLMIRDGDRAYLLKQGNEPRGIFGVGTVDGSPEERTPAIVGKRKSYAVQIRFEMLLDPMREMFTTRDELLRLQAAPQHRWDIESSGMPLEREAARLIEERVNARRQRDI